MLFVITSVHWCAARFLYQMMFVSLKSYTTGVSSGAGTAYPSRATEFTPFFVGFVLFNL